MVFGCNDDSTDGGGGVSTDPALNGTWVQLYIRQYSISGNTLTLTIYYTDGSTYVETFTKTSGGGGTDPLNGTWEEFTDLVGGSTYVFNNGHLELTTYNSAGYTWNFTGTYTTSGNKLMVLFQTGTEKEPTRQYSISGNKLTLYGETFTKTSSGDGTDPLNGTWERTSTEEDHGEMVTTTQTYKFNNNNKSFEWVESRRSDIRTYYYYYTGTYTTSNNNITMTNTTLTPSYKITFNNGILVLSHWGLTYTETYTTSGNNITIDGEVFQYSISGNTLTFWEMTFIKK